MSSASSSIAFGLVVLLVLGATASVAVGQIALGLVVVWAVVRAVRERWRPPRLGIEGVVLAFLAWAVLMVPFSEEPARSLNGLERFYLLTAMWLVAAEARDASRRRVLAFVFVVGGALVAVFGAMLWIADGGIVFRQRLVVVSNAMTSGALLMICTLVGVAFVSARGVRRRARSVFVVATCVLALALFMTMTRSALAGCVVGLLVLVVWRAPRRAWIAVGLSVAGLALVLFAGDLFLPDRLAARLAFDDVVGGRNTVARVEMWQAGLRMVAERPVTGFGDVSLGELSRAYYTTPPDRLHGHLHNDLVQIAVIWGVPGLLLYLAFVGRKLVVLARRRVDFDDAWVAAAAAVVVGYFVAGFTEWYFGDAEPLLLSSIVFGIGAAPLVGRGREEA